MKYYKYILIGLMTILKSCDTYLEVKPRSNLVIPETLDDMQQLLDNGTVFTSYPEFLELQADDFYFEEAFWNSMVNQVDKNAYVWSRDIFGTTESHSAWSQPYNKIFYSNAVLDGLKNIERNSTNGTQYDQIKGAALFLKAEAVYILAQLFAKVYDEKTGDADLGIPIPMSADINEDVHRPSLKYTFNFILDSFIEAEKLLSPVVDFSRPSKAAAHAMLSRVYLYMGVYEKAGLHSHKSLQSFDELIDLNNETVRDYRNTLLNRVISPNNYIMNNVANTTIIDTLLTDSYAADDLRAKVFYRKNAAGQFIKNGINNLSIYCFSGLDADEQYLIRAECYARNNQVSLALLDLNHVVSKRHALGTYVPYETSDKDELLSFILIERRKELVFRGLRWSDLKRLNREGRSKSLVRKLGERSFDLSPNDNRWTLPIPTNEINISGIQQNER